MKRLSVPILKQDKLDCGITSLRMVLQYFGKDVSKINNYQWNWELKDMMLEQLNWLILYKNWGLRFNVIHAIKN